MFWQNKKNFDFSSLIFDSRNILAASLKKESFLVVITEQAVTFYLPCFYPYKESPVKRKKHEYFKFLIIVILLPILNMKTATFYNACTSYFEILIIVTI